MGGLEIILPFSMYAGVERDSYLEWIKNLEADIELINTLMTATAGSSE